MNVEHSLPVRAEASAGDSTAGRGKLAAWARKRRWFLLIVVLPTILAAGYYSLVASDIYVSESRFVIKSPDQRQPQLSTLANLIQTTGLSSGQEQTNEILAFVRSRDALVALERRMNVRGVFAAAGADPLSRFPRPLTGETFEDLYDYYGGRVSAQQDQETGTAILSVEAFTPQDAYRINRELLTLSEELVNRLNLRAQERAISDAERQVELAGDRVRRARVELAQYRNSQSIIDPAEQATGVIEISNQLIAERAALQAQLDLMQRLAPQNPSIPALRSRISAMSVQIASQDSRVTGNRGGIASKLGGYENLFVEQEFATESLTAASAALVQARAEAQRQKFYLERIVDANRPDMPLLPNRFVSVLVVAAAALCLYFIGWMLIVGILEHAPED